MKRARPLLGTIVEITAKGENSSVSDMIDTAFSAIEEVHRLMSFHHETSDVTQINNADVGCPISIDSHTFNVLQFARELSEISSGYFDVTIAPLLIKSGFLPSNDILVERKHSCYRDLELLSDNRVRWRQPGCIDLGGIAKGYAVDRAIDVLRTKGAYLAVVNAGGDLRCFGEGQAIHLRHPHAPKQLMSVGYVTEVAIATSAGYFSRIDTGDEQIDPIADPHRKNCICWDGSVSVIADSCMIADALTKIVRLIPDAIPDIMARFEAQALVIDADGVRSCGKQLLQRSIA